MELRKNFCFAEWGLCRVSLGEGMSCSVSLKVLHQNASGESTEAAHTKTSELGKPFDLELQSYLDPYRTAHA